MRLLDLLTRHGLVAATLVAGERRYRLTPRGLETREISLLPVPPPRQWWVTLSRAHVEATDIQPSRRPAVFIRTGAAVARQYHLATGRPRSRGSDSRGERRHQLDRPLDRDKPLRVHRAAGACAQDPPDEFRSVFE